MLGTDMGRKFTHTQKATTSEQVKKVLQHSGIKADGQNGIVALKAC